jgi:hypothetical protein
MSGGQQAGGQSTASHCGVLFIVEMNTDITHLFGLTEGGWMHRAETSHKQEQLLRCASDHIPLQELLPLW